MKEVGAALGFDDENAKVRIAQFENSSRSPRPELLAALTGALRVRPERIAPAPEDPIDAVIEYILWLDEESIDTFSEGNARLSSFLSQYWQQRAKLACGEISKDDFIEWKLQYTPIDHINDNSE